ncbi:hypothetical protein K440DRAFT_637775 [Wilcoxina mikolae CBS 423.85]|nr:hypothetical protein K440DRAFT_637775 [Wilcoxina mikolae CBS 423.85]
MNYRRSVGDVARQLEIEKLKLENTFRKLLGGVVTPQELAILLSGNGWDNIRRKLSDHLGETALRIFESHMQTLSSIVQELGDELGLNENFQKIRHRRHDKSASVGLAGYRTKVEPEQKPDTGIDTDIQNTVSSIPGPDDPVNREEDLQEIRSRGLRTTIFGSLLEKKPTTGRKRHDQKEEEGKNWEGNDENCQIRDRRLSDRYGGNSNTSTAEFANEIRRLCARIETQFSTTLNYCLGTLDSASGQWKRMQTRNKPQTIQYMKTTVSIILIELWLGRIFEELEATDDTAWENARRLAGRQDMVDSGDDYIRAVERCRSRRCSVWDVQSAPRSLEHKDFKREVYATVVSVLEENYKRFVDIHTVLEP